MKFFGPKITFVTEHDLREKYHERWEAVLIKLSKDSDLLLHFSCGETDKIKKTILRIAKQLPPKTKVLIYEECIEKGGGGEVLELPPTLLTWHNVYRAFAFVVLTTAAGFLQEFGKDIYSKVKRNFFDLIRKLQFKGACSFRFATKTGIEIEYIFPKRLDLNEAMAAYKKAEIHFKDFYNRRKVADRIYYYDRKEKKWLPMIRSVI